VQGSVEYSKNTTQRKRMNKERFKKAAEIDKKLQDVDRAYSALIGHKSFQSNHKKHSLHLNSSSEDRGTHFSLSNLLNIDDMNKIVVALEEVLIEKSKELQKQFKEV